MEEKLDKVNIENIMGLTPTQQGMLFYYINGSDSTMYHEQLSLNILGDVKADLIQKAWNLVIENNEMLRTVYRWKGISTPVQIVLKQHEIRIKNFNFTNEKDKNEAIEKIKVGDLNNRIDIKKETLRIYLCKLDQYRYKMIISNHHILYDGWSNMIILKELMDIYNCLYKNKKLKRNNKTKFSEFVKYINNACKDQEQQYWRNYLANLNSVGEYFSYKDKGECKEIVYKMDENKTNKIKAFAKENKILLSSILYGAWGVFIQKISNSNDIIFGTIVSGRTEKIRAVDNMVGLFINTIPLRIKSDKQNTFINLICNLDKELTERKDFENTSLVDIRQYCGLKANVEMFNSIVTIENYPLDLGFGEEKVLTIDGFSMVAKTNYNMALEILAFSNIEFRFSFNTLAIDESVVEQFGGYLENIIDALIDNPSIKLQEIDLLSRKQKDQIIIELDKDEIMEELLDDQVEFNF